MIYGKLSFFIVYLFLSSIFLSCTSPQPQASFEGFIVNDGPRLSDKYPKGVWLKVDTAADNLFVMDGPNELFSIQNIAVGSAGVGEKTRIGDQVTPRGEFAIRYINRSSKFKVFYGLNFPNNEHARKAYKDGVISIGDYNRVKDANRRNQMPPQNTPLGGYIGIHGLGDADPYVHERLDWTDGCVAITNEDIAKLDDYIKLGTVVVIK